MILSKLIINIDIRNICQFIMIKILGVVHHINFNFIVSQAYSNYFANKSLYPCMRAYWVLPHVLAVV